MAVDLTPGTSAERRSRLEAVAAAGRALAEERTLEEALAGVVRPVARALGATVAVARVLDPGDRRLHALAVVSDSAAHAAILEGSRVDAAEAATEIDELGALPAVVRAAAAEAGAAAALLLPVSAAGRLVGSLELLRPRRSFRPEERRLARIAADHVGTAIRTFGYATRDHDGGRAAEWALGLVGEALAASADDVGTAAEVARAALRATSGTAALVWSAGGGSPSLVLTQGRAEPAVIAQALSLAERVGSEARAPGAGLEHLPGLCCLVTVPLGRPAAHVLQVVFPESPPPPEGVVTALARFGARSAHALAAAERSRSLRLELERTSTLLELVAQANEELSLAHTLQTAIERVGELLDVDRIGVYLQESGRLASAAGRALAGPHLQVAERLLELALASPRRRGMLVVEDAPMDPGLAGLENELADAGIDTAVAVPLLVSGEVVGLLGVYPPAGRTPRASEESLLAALAAQLAVSVQNARLHEEATKLAADRRQALERERQTTRHIQSLYEISRSFAESLSLDETLKAVATTVVDLLEVDAAVIRTPDARGEMLVPSQVRVVDPALGEPLREVFSQPQPLGALPRRSLQSGRPLVLDPTMAAQLAAYRVLTPFVEKGTTAVVLPIAASGELLGTVDLVSLDRARPITQETVDLGLHVAAQAALAIDKARLYQHQKEFADTMQRSLLPDQHPAAEGIELGEEYAYSARVDVGGDLYDFIALDDGRLAVVLGDVTGHGIDAAADMAMAKFVFRTLVRVDPEPGPFLAAANDIVCGEIGAGKFITMLYLTVEPGTGRLRCASAGHPPPRVVLPDGRVQALEARGLALGIEPGQEYPESSETLPPGAAVVLYTDGVVEARRDGELYGAERLDRVLARSRDLPPQELARAVLEDCRAFGEGDLADDCAIVVIRRTAR